MSSRDAIQAILGEFGRSIGLNDLTFDAAGYCALLFDEALVVNMEIDQGEQALVLYSLLGEPAGDAMTAYRDLLRANFRANRSDEAVLGMQPDSNAIVLSRWVALAGLELSQFSTALEQFVNAVESWTARLSQSEASAAPIEQVAPTSAIRA